MSSESGCSREASRIVRSLVQQRFLGSRSRKVARRVAESLPHGCLLRPEHDLYLSDELHKKGLRWNLWRCRYCGKSFVSEEYLDRHFDNKHPPNVTAFCPAELCDALDCSAAPGLARTPLARNKGERPRRRSRRRAARFASPCPDSTAIQARRDRCRRVLEACSLPTDACDKLSCLGGRLVGALPRPPTPHHAAERQPVLIVFYLIFLLIFYCGLYLQLSAAPAPKPIKRAHRRD